MIEQLRYGSYFLLEGIKHVLHIRREIHYDNQLCLDDTHANLFIRDQIKSGRPFLACRFGSGEMRAFLKTREVKMGLRKIVPESNMDSMCINAGFFPREQQALLHFGDLMEEACSLVDLLAIWGTLPMENYVLHRFVPQAKRCYLSGLEPFFARDEVWTMALEGKRVLVIHPFADTIRAQYEKKDQLFGEKKILPEFTLDTLKAVQSIGGQGDNRFHDWFEALDFMTDHALSRDFDVAIIGCGAYGFPLAARLKKAGRQAIHMGGATQLLFGIRGKRWDQKPEYQPFINDSWVRPAGTEKPAAAKRIEDSCYW